MSRRPGAWRGVPGAWTPTSLLTADVYVFGVGPLVDQVNINALASKKDGEQHVFKVRDMEHLEDVFFQMIGRETRAPALAQHPMPWPSPVSLSSGSPLVSFLHGHGNRGRASKNWASTWLAHRVLNPEFFSLRPVLPCGLCLLWAPAAHGHAGTL